MPYYPNDSDGAKRFDTHNAYAYGIVVSPEEVARNEVRPGYCGDYPLVRVNVDGEERWANCHRYFSKEHKQVWYGVRYWLRGGSNDGDAYLMGRNWVYTRGEGWSRPPDDPEVWSTAYGDMSAPKALALFLKEFSEHFDGMVERHNCNTGAHLLEALRLFVEEETAFQADLERMVIST
tara:strand:- start:114 stop:647 length:534 start_codon:yes stop_codon:yes gene_type:complete